MKVLVDTCIWSLVFRGNRRKNAGLEQEMKNLIDDARVEIIGPIRQELLSGYKDLKRFRIIQQHLFHFPNSPILDEDYETAARFHNACRSEGIQGSHTDFLICAFCVRSGSLIFTHDKDFQHYLQHLPIRLYQPAFS